MLEDNGRHRRPAPPKPAILTVPVALRGVRARPRRLAVLGFLVLLVTAAVVLGVRVAWARSSAQPRPVAATAHGPPGGLASRTVPVAFASAGATGLPTAAGVVLSSVAMARTASKMRQLRSLSNPAMRSFHLSRRVPPGAG